jgi:glyoxylase-like metal-dependent hydrolase (beta-lactamase superfamily II)
MAKTHLNAFRQHEDGIIGIGTQPSFAIGQRALLLLTPQGNILWDCISFLDDATRTLIDGLGGIKTIAISHPHFYTAMNEWSRAFDAPVYLHAADKKWIMNPSDRLVFWEGETHKLAPDITLIRCGGHFPGGTALHWTKGKGVLCPADMLSVGPDLNVSFMRSYPNLIPLSAREVEGIAAAVEPFAFDTIYGHFFDRVIRTGAKGVVRRSVARYLAAIAGTARKDGE